MTTQSSKQTSTILDTISKLWPVVLSIIGMIGVWYSLSSTVSADTNDIAALKSHQTEEDKTQTQILVGIGQIQTDVGWMKSRLSDTAHR